MIIPRLVMRFVQHLRSHSPLCLASNVLLTTDEFPSLSSLFDLFDDLCRTGSPLRSIFTQCLLNTQFYQRSNTELQAKDLAHDRYMQQIKAIASLSVPLSLRVQPASVDIAKQQAACFLEELLFWLIKYQIPERLMKFLLTLLTDAEFKDAFTPSFLNVYAMAIAQWSCARESTERRHSSRLMHLSVQLFSNGRIIRKAVDEYQLIEIMLASLSSIFSSIKTPCQLQNSKENFHRVIAERSFSPTMHYWSLVSDFVNVLSHEYASQRFVTDARYFITWIEMISWFQGMNVNDCDINSASALSFDTDYLFAFNAEMECCATALWTLIAHIQKPVSSVQLLNSSPR